MRRFGSTPFPYLVPDHARTVLKVTDEPLERSHQAVLEAAAQRIRDDLDSLTDPPDATVVIAHAFVTGGSTSESERDISVGGIDSVSADVFPGSTTLRSDISTARRPFRARMAQ